MRGFWTRKDGQALFLFAAALFVLLGMAALAIDVGYLYTVRSSLQRAADAGCLAGGSGLLVSQAEASSRGTDFAGRNLTGILSGATTTVSFPAPTTVRVDVSHPQVRLFFGGVLGKPTALVSANAACSVALAGSVWGDAVPLAVYCNNATGCDGGVLAPGQVHTLKWRYCGNFFEDAAQPGGDVKDACGQTVAAGEIFVQGITFELPPESTAVLREEVYNGLQRNLNIGDVVGALPGDRVGWRSGMEDRLREERREMTFIGVRPQTDRRMMEVVDFIKVRVTDFRRQGPTERITFEILQVVTSTSFASGGGARYGVNSVYGVQLVQ